MQEPPHSASGPSDGSLADLTRDLEGSTHGGPRHAMVFESIKTQVANHPDASLDQIPNLPTSARSVLLMVVSGLGRRMLPSVLRRLGGSETQSRDAAMILRIWAARGLICRSDRTAIESALQTADEPTRQIVGDALAQLRS